MAVLNDNFRNDIVMAATQQFFMADMRRRMKVAFGVGVSYADIDAWMSDVTESRENGSWHAVLTGRILMRTLSASWSCDEMIKKRKSNTEKNKFKGVYNNQLLPSILPTCAPASNHLFHFYRRGNISSISNAQPLHFWASLPPRLQRNAHSALS